MTITALKWPVTITDDHIQIGCHQYELEKALRLGEKWKQTKESIEEAGDLEPERKLLMEAIRLRLSQRKKEGK